MLIEMQFVLVEVTLVLNKKTEAEPAALAGAFITGKNTKVVNLKRRMLAFVVKSRSCYACGQPADEWDLSNWNPASCLICTGKMLKLGR